MKKMMFAFACASTLALFADVAAPKADFEGYGANVDKIGGFDDTGSDNGDIFWSFLGATGTTDGSSVKSYNGDNLAKPEKVDVGDNYLELSTEGGTLWRSLNPADNGTVLGDEETVAASGIYVDTMVQFTPTEDGGVPEIGGDDQLAIWLNVDADGNTNLCVRAAQAHDTGTSSTFEPTTYVLAGTSDIQPGQWYHLTVKTIADVDQRMARNEAYSTGITGFLISLNGQILHTETPTFTEGYLSLACDAGEWGWLDESQDGDVIDLLESGTVFPSLKGEVTASTLTAVGFKGSGAVDNLQITTEDPNPVDPAGDKDYPSYVSDADKAAFDAWAESNGITGDARKDAENALQDKFLLNIAATAEASLAIEAIEAVEGGWKITVGSEAQADLSTINGVLVIKTAAALDGEWTTVSVEPEFEGGKAEITVTDAAAKFMKAAVVCKPVAE